MQFLRLQLGISCHIMQVIKGTLLFGAFAEEFWFVQSTNVLVEDVFVLCVAG